MTDAETMRFLAYYDAPEAGLASVDRLRAFVNRLGQERYALANGYAWPFTEPQNLIREPAQIDQAVAAACRPNGSSPLLTFWRHPFEFNFALDAQKKQYWLVEVPVDTLMGPRNELGEQNTVDWIKVVTLALENYPPFYGCAFGLQSPPPFDRGADLPVTDVYPINFFGPRYLARHKLDKQRLLSAPVQVKGEIARGVLLVPSLRAVYSDDPASLLKVKQHLGWA